MAEDSLSVEQGEMETLIPPNVAKDVLDAEERNVIFKRLCAPRVDYSNRHQNAAQVRQRKLSVEEVAEVLRRLQPRGKPPISFEEAPTESVKVKVPLRSRIEQEKICEKLARPREAPDEEGSDRQFDPIIIKNPEYRHVKARYLNLSAAPTVNLGNDHTAENRSESPVRKTHTFVNNDTLSIRKRLLRETGLRSYKVDLLTGKEVAVGEPMRTRQDQNRTVERLSKTTEEISEEREMIRGAIVDEILWIYVAVCRDLPKMTGQLRMWFGEQVDELHKGHMEPPVKIKARLLRELPQNSDKLWQRTIRILTTASKAFLLGLRGRLLRRILTLRDEALSQKETTRPSPIKSPVQYESKAQREERRGSNLSFLTQLGM
ncbi:hypothetical protein FOL47_010545 [Perkinsus chesapeaki]|uniref:Uncharacterized protein n=1 Tax=Perkinsus chesapeaki TaxID=330153 RepID=A0A7J6L3G2_PERCH|nr:hypothetical protein FOL47_010545 [Perkinsus chesapeaki]